MTKKHLIICLCLGVLCFLFANEAYAVDKNFVSTISGKYYDISKSWLPVIQQYAKSVFATCLTMSIIMIGLGLAFRQTDIGQALQSFVMTCLMGGLSLAIINHPEWSNDIINKMSSVALAAGGADPTESAFMVGVNIAAKLLKNTSFTSPVDSLAIVLCAGIIVGCFALIQAQILIILCMSYILTTAGIIIVPLGAMIFTRDYMINYIKYVFARLCLHKIYDIRLCISLRGCTYVESTTPS